MLYVVIFAKQHLVLRILVKVLQIIVKVVYHWVAHVISPTAKMIILLDAQDTYYVSQEVILVNVTKTQLFRC